MEVIKLPGGKGASYKKLAEVKFQFILLCTTKLILPDQLNSVKGAGGLHQDFLKIDFLVVSYKEE